MPQPYWPTLWAYIESNRKRAARRERLSLLAREWQERRGLARLFGLAGWSAFFGYRRLATPGTLEQRYLRWSRAGALLQGALLTVVLAPIVEGLYWSGSRGLPLEVLVARWSYLLFRELPLPDRIEIPPANAAARSFMMGGDRHPWEQPIRRVTFPAPFSMTPTEVTFEQWDACVADGGCRGYLPGDQGWGRGTRPVINVSWHDAQAYVEWLSRKKGTTCRLPSEAEWDYACRAGTEKEFALPAPEGSDDIAGQELANCFDCGSEWDGRQTAPVGEFQANAWGLHDMHGNVLEWVEDCWHPTYEGAPEDGRAWLEDDGGDCDTRVLRGGSWSFNSGFARCAGRSWFNPGVRLISVGFRVVCSSPIANR
jgi:formylglycine-generating enzyme required for sulfatase activity